MVSDHSENVEFYRYRQSDGSAIAKIEPLAEVGGVGPACSSAVWWLLSDAGGCCTGALFAIIACWLAPWPEAVLAVALAMLALAVLWPLPSGSRIVMPN